jgi:hypothetical protein
MKVAALAFAIAMIAAAPAAAQDSPLPRLGPSEAIEVEARADLNGDGIIDVAYIVRRGDMRELQVVTSYRSKVEIGVNQPQTLALDPYPLGDATLTVANKVLVLKDLTGGTTAVASTHRFRWDPKLAAMRLIGLDATLYSRTFAHDGSEASWNLLTGTLVTRNLNLTTGSDNRGYRKVGEKRARKPSKPLRLEASPSGDDLLGGLGKP